MTLSTQKNKSTVQRQYRCEKGKSVIQGWK